MICNEKRKPELTCIGYQARLVGNNFTRYSRRVLDIFKEMTLGNDAETWIKGLKCGIKAMQELQAHYDGTSEGARMKQVAIEELKRILYNNDTTFKFEKYVTKLKGIFNVLEKDAVLIYEDQTTKNVLCQIMSPNAELKTEINICRSSHSSTFVKVSTYLSTVVSRLYLSANPSSGRFIKRSIYAS